MENRLQSDEGVSHSIVAASESSAPEPITASDLAEAAVAVEEVSVGEKVTAAEDSAVSFDETAESSFLGEARDRGETVSISPVAAAAIEESTDPKSLPPLSELVNRIAPEIRAALEDLFRAKFVTVRRVPAKALKS